MRKTAMSNEKDILSGIICYWNYESFKNAHPKIYATPKICKGKNPHLVNLLKFICLHVWTVTSEKFFTF